MDSIPIDDFDLWEPVRGVVGWGFGLAVAGLRTWTGLRTQISPANAARKSARSMLPTALEQSANDCRRAQRRLAVLVEDALDIGDLRTALASKGGTQLEKLRLWNDVAAHRVAHIATLVVGFAVFHVAMPCRAALSLVQQVRKAESQQMAGGVVANVMMTQLMERLGSGFLMLPSTDDESRFAAAVVPDWTRTIGAIALAAARETLPQDAAYIGKPITGPAVADWVLAVVNRTLDELPVRLLTAQCSFDEEYDGGASVTAQLQRVLATPPALALLRQFAIVAQRQLVVPAVAKCVMSAGRYDSASQTCPALQCVSSLGTVITEVATNGVTPRFLPGVRGFAEALLLGNMTT
jgi:hypothetical protein